MKKFLAVFLIAATALTVFAGCSENGEELNIYSEASYDNESKFVPKEESKESATSESGTSDEEYVPLSGEFIVKDKKYTFEGNDLVLVSVENKTNKNYSVTITGTYLDKDGKAIKTETKEFEGFYSGYQNFFLFKPDINFEKFEYEVEVETYDATCHAASVKLTVPKIEKTRSCITELQIQGDFQKYPTLIVYISGGNSSDIDLIAHSHIILFNEKGDIVGYKSHIPKILANTAHGIDFDGWELYQSTEEFEEWPEELQGTLSAVVCIDKITCQ